MSNPSAAADFAALEMAYALADARIASALDGTEEEAAAALAELRAAHQALADAGHYRLNFWCPPSAA